MATDAASLLRDALKLGHDDRAGLAAALFDSLDDVPGVADVDSPDWLEEIARRAQEASRDASVVEDWDVARTRILGGLRDA